MQKVETIRKKIIQDVEKASESDLSRIKNYIENLRERERKKKEILSYAGSWSDMPRSMVNELTINLQRTRKSRRNILK